MAESRKSRDSESDKDPSDASRDEELKKKLFSDESSDSEVKTDSSDASRNKELSERFDGLVVSEENGDGQWLSGHP